MRIPDQARVSHIIYYIGRPLLIFLCWDVLVTLSYVYGLNWLDFPALPLPLFGSAIAIYLTFRNSTAYARWWEARTAWGSMVNLSRSFVRELAIAVEVYDKLLFQMLSRRHVSYIHALRLHLRRAEPWDELSTRLSGDEIVKLRSIANVPNAVLMETARILSKESALDSIKLAMLEQTMTNMSNAQGTMERIKNTPIPPQYSTYPITLTHIFCVLVPIGLVEDMGWVTPVASTLVSLLLLLLLQIGNDIADPFNNAADDVPLSALARSIEIDVLDAADIEHALVPKRAKRGVLL